MLQESPDAFLFCYNSGVMLNIASAVEAERAGEGERGGLTRAGPGRGGSARQHLIVNKRGVSSHADQVTAGNKRAI